MHVFTYIQTGTFSHMLMNIHTQVTHSHTKQGAALNPNQTAMSHTVTVATVAGSMQNTFCYISGVLFFSLCAAHRRTQLSATVIPALIS